MFNFDLSIQQKNELSTLGGLATYNYFYQDTQNNPQLYTGEFAQRIANLFSNFITNNQEIAIKHGYNFEIANRYSPVTEIQFNPAIEIQAKEIELKISSESFYDKIYETASDMAQKAKNTSNKLASHVVDKAIQKTAEEFLKQSIGYAGEVFKNHPEKTMMIAAATGQEIFKQMAENQKTKEELEHIKNEFIEKLQDTKRIEAAKKATECIFSPTPGCNEEVKRLMDALDAEQPS